MHDSRGGGRGVRLRGGVLEAILEADRFTI
jgi:hypothetical protein